MDIDWRFVAVCAGIAFIFSLIAGIFGGVRFGTLFARAFIGAAVFGTVGAGLYYLIKTQLPELISGDGAASGDESETEPARMEGFEETEAAADPGSNVNIVVGDDDDVDDSPQVEGMSDDEPAELESVDGEEGGFSPFDTNPQGSDDSDGIPVSENGFVEEVREGLPPDSGAVVADDDEDDDIQELESVDDEPSAMSPAANGADTAPAVGASDASIDVLPDMDDFGSTFGAGVSEESTSGNASDGMPVDVMGDQHNTSELAKAIQTVMKKDEKG